MNLEESSTGSAPLWPSRTQQVSPSSWLPLGVGGQVCGQCGGRPEPGLDVIRKASLRAGPPGLFPKQAASSEPRWGPHRRPPCGAPHCPNQPAEDRRGRCQVLQALAGRASWEEPVGTRQAGSGRNTEPLLNTRLQHLHLKQGGLHLEEDQAQGISFSTGTFLLH